MQSSTINKTTLLGASVPTAPISIFDLVFDQGRRDSTNIALSDGSRCMSWSALMAAVAIAARNLIALRLEPGTAVATYMTRSPEWIVVMLAIWHAGHVYVPLNKKTPVERNQRFLQQVDAQLVVCDPCDTDLFESSINIDRLLLANDDQAGVLPSRCSIDACYMFTSGSTGEPKVIRYAQCDLSEYMQTFGHALAIANDYPVRVLQFCECSFDAHLLETLLALTTGGQLCLLEKGEFVDFAGYVNAIERDGVNIIIPPTTFWHQWSAAVAAGSSYFPRCLRKVLVGGEKPIPKYFCGRHVPDTLMVFNGYGPAEGIVCASIQAVSKDMLADDADIPAGTPTPNRKISIVDADLMQVEDGAVGEVFLHGKGLAAGYRNADILADKNFTQAMISGSLTYGYRTGDAGFIGEDGLLHFSGRIDAQIKVNGKRFEPGEVEAEILELPAIRNAVVLLHQANGISTLVAMLEVSDLAIVGPLRDRLKTRLPAHMIPVHCVCLDAFPKTLNGKVDRKALLDTYEQRRCAGDLADDRLDSIESAVLSCWDECVGKRCLDGDMMDTDFIELESSSLSRGIFLAELLHRFAIEDAHARFTRCSSLRQISEQIKVLKELRT